MFQYSVTLQSEETISEECRKKTAQGSAVTSYVRSQDMCLQTLKSHFSVPVPLTATPGFITDIGRILNKQTAGTVAFSILLFLNPFC